MKMPIAGGAPIKLATGQFLDRIAVDADNVYLTGADSVMKVSTQGGALTTLASNQTSASSIAVDAANVYWTALTTESCPPNGDLCADGVVREVPIAGGTVTTLASGQARPAGIAIDEQNVYWINLAFNIADGAVMKVPLAGGMPTTLASGQFGVNGYIAVGGGNVYWTAAGGGTNNPTVTKVPIAGGTATSVVNGSSAGADILVVAGNVYWLEGYVSGITVKTASLDGGAPSLVGWVTNANGIAVDTTNVYWIEPGIAGRVWTLGANTCENSECQCPATQAVCFGVCIDLQTDPMNCGACGAHCPQAMTCRSGACTAL